MRSIVGLRERTLSGHPNRSQLSSVNNTRILLCVASPFPVARSRAAHCAATPPGCWRSHSLVRVRRRFLRLPRQGVPPAELRCPGRRPVPVADDGIPPRSQLDLSVQTRGFPSPSSLCRESRCRRGPTCFSVPSLAAGRPLSISPSSGGSATLRNRKRPAIYIRIASNPIGLAALDTGGRWMSH